MRQETEEEETGDGSVSPFPQGKQETQNRPLSPPLSPQKRENDADKGNFV